MGKCKNATPGKADVQKSAFSTPSSHRGEADDTGGKVQYLRDDVDLLEEGMSQMGASPKDALQISTFQLIAFQMISNA